MTSAQDVRSSRTILFAIIAACCLLFIICAGIGFFFGDIIISSCDLNVLAELKENTPFWLPILIFLAILLLFGWGAAVTFAGITSHRMKATTTGEICGSVLRQYYDSDEGDVYYIVSGVAYAVGGCRYQNEGRHRFTSNDESEAIKKMKGMKPGDPVIVVYDPKNPDSMTLDSPDINPKGEIMAGAGFIAGGLWLSFFLGFILPRFR